MVNNILFILRDLKQGGIPRCLQTLLTYIDTSRCNVDVLCMYKEGPYVNNLPNCKILDCGTIVHDLCVFNTEVKSLNLLKKVRILGFKFLRKLLFKVLNKDLLYCQLNKQSKKNNGRYDVVISYSEGDPAYLAERIKCPRKLIWIHNDYKWIPYVGENTNFEIFDKICCVSESTRLSFCEKYHNLESKTIALYNLVNIDAIKKFSFDKVLDCSFDGNKFSIISVGRICYQKNFDVIPLVASNLKKQGLNFVWYIVGSGPENEVLTVKENIIKYDVSDCIVMLGQKNNPYKYIAKVNLYALTSRYESYPTVINEAKVLRIPIISTDIPPAFEMINENDGLICNIDYFADEISKMIKDETYYKSFCTEKFKDNNNKLMEQFYSLLN